MIDSPDPTGHKSHCMLVMRYSASEWKCTCGVWCPACKGKGVGIFTPPGELTYSGQCPQCKGSGKVKQ